MGEIALQFLSTTSLLAAFKDLGTQGLPATTDNNRTRGRGTT